MKMMVGLVGVLLLANPSISAQEPETLIGGDVRSGGFGGPVVKIGPLNGETGVFVGGRGGWILNETFILGGGGYGLVSNVIASIPGPRGERFIGFGYGGLELEYVPTSYRLVHLSFMVLIGGGGLMYRHADGDIDFDSRHMNDAVFVLEPQVSVTLNVIRWMRLSAGLSYRYVNGVDIPASSDTKMSGPSGHFTLRFGKF